MRTNCTWRYNFFFYKKTCIVQRNSPLWVPLKKRKENETELQRDKETTYITTTRMIIEVSVTMNLLPTSTMCRNSFKELSVVHSTAFHLVDLS